MEKDGMEKEKNIMNMADYHLKVNIEITGLPKVKYMIKKGI